MTRMHSANWSQQIFFWRLSEKLRSTSPPRKQLKEWLTRPARCQSGLFPRAPCAERHLATAGAGDDKSARAIKPVGRSSAGQEIRFRNSPALGFAGFRSSILAGTKRASDFLVSRQGVISETEVPVATEQATVDFPLAKLEVDAVTSLVQIGRLAFGGADGTEGLLQVGKHSCILSLGAAGIIIVPAFVSCSYEPKHSYLC